MNVHHAPLAQRAERIVAIVLTVFLIAAQLTHLFYVGPLWRDEISTLTMATHGTIGSIWTQLFIDPFPLLFFLVLRAWHGIVGDDDFKLRILGCAISVAATLIFWVVARLTGRRPPLLTVALFGLCPTFILWGSTLRAYGFGILWVLLSFGFFWRVATTNRPWEMAAALFCAIAAVQSVYTNALLIFACGVASCAVAVRRGAWRRGATALAIGAITALTLVPYYFRVNQATGWAGAYRINYSLYNSFRMLAAALHGSDHALFWFWAVCLPLALVYAVRLQFAPRGDVSAPSPMPDLALYGMLCAIIAIVATMTFFWVVGWGTNVWYYLPMLAIAACGIDAISQAASTAGRTALILRTAIAAAAVALSIGPLSETIVTRVTNMDLVARIFEKAAAPDDVLVIHPNVDGVTFERYYKGRNEWITIPRMAHIPIDPKADVLREFREPNAVGRVLDKIASTLQAGHRVWFASSWPAPPPGGPPPEVPPLRDGDTRAVSNFLRRWQLAILYQLRAHGGEIQAIDLSSGQPVAYQEREHLFVISGWKE